MLLFRKMRVEVDKGDPRGIRKPLVQYPTLFFPPSTFSLSLLILLIKCKSPLGNHKITGNVGICIP